MPNETTIDWRSILVRYMRAVMDHDLIVGDSCLVPNSAWSPEWSDAEVKALVAVHREAWPEGMVPWRFDVSDWGPAGAP